MKRSSIKAIEKMSYETASKELKKHSNDNGSMGITIWYMSQKIVKMRDHIAKNKKDKVTYRKFLELISKRKKISKYLTDELQ